MSNFLGYLGGSTITWGGYYCGYYSYYLALPGLVK